MISPERGKLPAARVMDAGKVRVIDTERTFTVASDTSLVELIRRASKRLIVISPALTTQSRQHSPIAFMISVNSPLRSCWMLTLRSIVWAMEPSQLSRSCGMSASRVCSTSECSPACEFGVVISDEDYPAVRAGANAD